MSKTKEAKPNPPEYVMPPVGRGDVVLWRENHSDAVRDASPAIVTAVGIDSVSVGILHPMAQAFAVKDGVRHVDHPDRNVENSEGYWSHKPEDEERLALLEERLAHLEAALSEPKKA